MPKLFDAKPLDAKPLDAKSFDAKSFDAKSFDNKSEPDDNLKHAFVTQVIVGTSALASTALLLAQALPPLLHGVP